MIFNMKLVERQTLLNKFGILNYKSDESFFNQSLTVISRDGKLKKNEYYVLEKSCTTGRYNLTLIKLLSIADNNEGIIYRDVLFNKTYNLHFQKNISQIDCTYLIYDLDYLNELITRRKVEKYCHCK